MISSICVYCGSNKGNSPEYAIAAADFGRLLAEKNIQLVYGGGQVGLMGIVADAVLEHGGKAVGITPTFLTEREIHHHQLSELIVVDTMHERKQMMADMADAFVALPGGLGTLDELFEILTWHQLHLHRKPIGLLNVNGYFDPVIQMMDNMVKEGFLHGANRNIIINSDDIYDLLQQLSGYKPSEERNWYVDVR